MRFINELHEGDRVSGIYLCKQKQSAMTKNGKPYDNDPAGQDRCTGR